MKAEPFAIILDTDFDTDCDDVGALVVLHALADQGYVRFAGVVSSVPIPSCVPCIRAMNASLGCETLPVAGVRVPDWEHNPAYVPYRKHRESCMAAGRIYNDLISQAHASSERSVCISATCGESLDAVALYRRLLARGNDGGTTICAVGTLTALAQLLLSPADEISPLCGLQLVFRKVDQLITMAMADFPSGRDRFNWRMDLPAAVHVLEHWPIRIVVSSLGGDVLTGKRFVDAAPEGHPAALAYQIWFGDAVPLRPSWDQVAVMYAACPHSGLFQVHPGHTLALDADTGRHIWAAASTERERAFITSRVPASTLADAVESRMIEALGVVGVNQGLEAGIMTGSECH